MERISSYQFTWLRWTGRSIHELGLQCRYLDITSGRGKRILRKAVIGFCRGENLQCRPKKNTVAVMCFHGGEHFWFHLRKQEFNEVFSET